MPQGGPLSPLLANVVLDDLDKELESRGHHFARYADDFVILVKSLRAGERVMASVTLFLERTLKLKVNEDKSKVVKTSELEFLGFAFRGSRIQWSGKVLSDLKVAFTQTDGPELGRFNVVATGKAQAIYAWVDRLLRNRPRIRFVLQVGQLDTATYQMLLLETVENDPKPDS